MNEDKLVKTHQADWHIEPTVVSTNELEQRVLDTPVAVPTKDQGE